MVLMRLASRLGLWWLARSDQERLVLALTVVMVLFLMAIS
jgi:hypothetical protein